MNGMTMGEAMHDALNRMSSGLGGTRKKVDADLVKTYLWIIEEDSLLPDDVLSAATWFCRSGEGSFPAGPIFRRQCLAEKYRRERREESAAYEARMEAQGDLYADEHEPPMSKADWKKHLAEVFARMESKIKKPWPGEEPPRDMKREIARMRAS